MEVHWLSGGGADIVFHFFLTKVERRKVKPWRSA